MKVDQSPRIAQGKPVQGLKNAGDPVLETMGRIKKDRDPDRGTKDATGGMITTETVETTTPGTGGTEGGIGTETEETGDATTDVGGGGADGKGVAVGEASGGMNKGS